MLLNTSKGVYAKYFLKGVLASRERGAKNVDEYVLFRVISQSQKWIWIQMTFWSTFFSHVYEQLKLPSVTTTNKRRQNESAAISVWAPPLFVIFDLQFAGHPWCLVS